MKKLNLEDFGTKHFKENASKAIKKIKQYKDKQKTNNHIKTNQENKNNNAQ